MVSSYFDLVNTANLERHKEIISKANSQGDLITEQFYEFRNRHLARLSETTVEPLLSLIYGDMLNAYRRVRDHILNIAETLAGEK
jgi:phosphate:Na+ symporter